MNKLLSNASTGLAVFAIAVSLATLLSLVDLNRELILSALAALAGAAVSFAYALLFIRIRRRARERNKPRVFISYSHKDAEFVNKLSAELEAMGVVPLLDRLELKVGDEIRSAVDDMIDRCDYVLHVASSNALESSWSTREIEQAVKREKKILPVLLEAGSLPEPLRDFYYADFTEEFQKGIEALDRTLRRQPGFLN